MNALAVSEPTQTPAIGHAPGFNLAVACLKINIVAQEALHLPAFAGSKLEGAFGRALYDLACTRRDLTTCTGCPLLAICPYGCLYEPQKPAHLAVSSLQKPPRPLAFAVAFGREQQLQAGERLSFGLTVIGAAILNHLPYIIAAIRMMGERGLGVLRGRFWLESVESQQPYTGQSVMLTEGDSAVVRHDPLLVNNQDLPAIPAQQLKLRLLSFANITVGGEMAEHLHLTVLVRALGRRLSNLEQLYGAGKSAGADYGVLPALAREVETVAHDMRAVWQYRQGKSGKPVRMAGLLGTVVYQGDLQPFGQLLRYGELVGVGDWAHFGAGRYVVEGV
jgi:hypothetical protein